MVAFLSRWPLARAAAEEAVKFIDDQPLSACSPLGARVAYSVNEYRLCTPLRPRRLKDYLVYEEHKKKSMARKGMALPDLWYRMPTYTNRNVCGIADPDEEIWWPAYTNKLDFEFELAVVIGKRGRDIKAADAPDYIAGFTIFNDFSARDVQADEGTIGAGAGKSKDFDQGNVLGPCIVTPDEIDGMNIEMILRVNGEEWSRGQYPRNEVYVERYYRKRISWGNDLSRRRLCFGHHGQRLLSRTGTLVRAWSNDRAGSWRHWNSTKQSGEGN